ncbi:MAG TPA: OmpA family protein [Cyclobacteriaceae bacterium]|nr:OmpA family protein [Cyclobacteriaceae bacterium]
MKIIAFVFFSFVIISCTPLGYPVNEGREYGNPRMPIVVTHASERGQLLLSKAGTPRHNVFTRTLCFKKSCRAKMGRQKALHPISFEKFRKKIAKNAKKGEYNYKRDTTAKPVKKPVIKKDTSRVIAQTLPPVAENPAAPVLKTDSLITLSDVLFETNSSTLKSEHFPDLASVIDFMLAHPSVVLKVSGHTDNTGSEAHNKSLSYKRAEVVAEYVVDNGVPIDRVTFEGLGSSKPLMPNGTEAGRRKNRRVELLLHDKLK